MFMKIDDIKGDATDSSHKDAIEVHAWHWGMTQTGTSHSGGAGGGAGKVQVQDLSFTHYVDRASPNLIKLCCSGKHFKTAQLIVRKAGGKPLEYIKITLSDGLIAAVTTGGSGGEDRLTENVTLNFAAFKYEYTPQKADGSGDAAIPAQWNISTNSEK
jgi:type VI secretion system secreted protein Hcp